MDKHVQCMYMQLYTKKSIQIWFQKTEILGISEIKHLSANPNISIIQKCFNFEFIIFKFFLSFFIAGTLDSN